MSEEQLALFKLPTIDQQAVKDETNIERKVLRLLPYGSENPISRSRVTDVLGVDVRAVSNIIARLTNEGVPIGMDNGYYLISIEEELQRTYTNIRTSGLSMMLRAERLKQNYYNQFKDTKKAVHAD
ncbi:hypothetical protein [Limosilactobacillus coleohominis]|uniref:hypothetical protein n=1 Tax=Limosilactobacillus coleohominis TaxID=181675 RepID=UPI0019568B8F|nr:hypothetical protein [Limosilactobacillus coleohominis]MBM6955451.1 hypothetical protein [Limosilactobacillus coleohominis]